MPGLLRAEKEEDMAVTVPLTCLFYTVAGYLSGCMMYAYWLPKWIKGVDVRAYGEDRNPGAANATRACGLPMGVLCAVMDILKGTVPVTLAIWVGQLTGWYMVPVVLAPVSGHAWPIFFGGRGGKAIAVSFGVLIGLMPPILLAPLWAVLLLICLPFIHDHRELIITTSALMAIGTFLLYPMPEVRAMACGVAAILMIKHRKKPEALTGNEMVQPDDSMSA